MLITPSISAELSTAGMFAGFERFVTRHPACFAARSIMFSATRLMRLPCDISLISCHPRTAIAKAVNHPSHSPILAPIFFILGKYSRNHLALSRKKFTRVARFNFPHREHLQTTLRPIAVLTITLPPQSHGAVHTARFLFISDPPWLSPRYGETRPEPFLRAWF